MPQPNGKIQIKDFTFKPGEATPMPQEEALLFLEISESFRVRNSTGQIVRPRRLGAMSERTVRLRPHELAVPVTAVLKEYLYELCRSLPGGIEKFRDLKLDRRLEMEEFIIAGGIQDEDADGNKYDTVVAA